MKLIEYEIWKDVKGYEGFYQISGRARVRSVARLIKHNTGSMFIRQGKLLKTRKDVQGYVVVYLYKFGVDVNKGVHRLMGVAFVHNPLNKPFVNHLNSIRHDNRCENFSWVTNAENVQQSFDQGISCNKGDKHPTRVLSIEMVKQMRIMKSNGYAVNDIAKNYSVKPRTVYAALGGQNWNYPETYI